jgi:hypothetical protein
VANCETEWDNPIWGWLVFNYLDNAIQFFLEDGTSYREVRLRHEDQIAKPGKWLPFKNTDTLTETTKQVHHFIKQIADSPSCLKAVMYMISDAMNHSAAAPTAYSQFLNSIVGRPLALVNMAWSLELGTDEYTNQSGLVDNDPLWYLLDETIKKSRRRDGELYTFPLKLGDKSRAYDGLVGYFRLSPPINRDGRIIST